MSVASYDAVIKLVVQGEDALKRLQERVDKLYKTIDDLERKKKFSGSEAAVKFVREQANQLERVVAVSKQIIKVDEQRIVKQSKLNAAVDLYERRLQQTVNSGAAGLKKFEGQIKEIQVAFKFFKDRENVTAIQALATELGRMVEYSNSVNRNARAVASNKSKVFEYTKKINAYEAQGLEVSRAREKLEQFIAVSGTNQLNTAKKYAEAVERQLRLLKEQVTIQKRLGAETDDVQKALAKLEAEQRDLENSKLDQKALQIQQALDRQAAAAAETAAQIDKLNTRQSEFITRTDAAAQAAARQTAEFIRQQRITKEVSRLNADAPPPQLLLPPASPGTRGGGRTLEVLGGARTQDQAATALRFAQALTEQVRPLNQIQALYAGIAQQAAQMQRIKALPDSAMLNAAGRGIKLLETSQDRYNRELQESAQRLQQLDRLEQTRERRARKLQSIADYYGSSSAMKNDGFGFKGTAVPSKRSPKATGGRTAGQMMENLMLGAGFPLLFGGGPAQVAGGLLGSFVGTGFGGQILGSALAQQFADATARITEIGNALDTLNMDNLRNSVIYVNAELDTTVRRLIEAGDAQEAQKVAAQAVFEQTGMLPEAVARISDNSNILANTWNQFSAAASGTLSIIGQPFVIALQVITSGLTKILQYSNYILTAAGEWLDKHLGWIAQNPVIQGILANILNGNTAITEEQEKQNALLQEATDKLREELSLVTKLDALKQAEVSNATFYGQIINEELRKKAELIQLEDEYNKKRKDARLEYAGLDLEEHTRKLDQLEQIKRKEIERTSEEKKRILLLKQADADRALALQQQTSQLNLQSNAIQQQLNLVQAQAQAQTTINNIEIQTLERVKDMVTAYDTKIRIINKILRLEVANAKIAFDSAVAQIRANERLAELARIAAVQKLKNLEIDLLSAAAKGEEVTNYQKAVMAGKEAVDIAAQNLDFTRQIGAEQLRAAEATYNAAVQAANLKAQTSAAAVAAERFAGAMGDAATAAGAAAEATDAFAPGAQTTSFTKFIRRPVTAEMIDSFKRQFAMYGATRFGFDTERAAEMNAEFQQRREALSQDLAANIQNLRATPTENGVGTPSSINIQTGPVLQQDGNKYVTLEDMESALQSMASTMYSSNRSAGTQRLTGVR